MRTKPCLTLEDCRTITDAAIVEAKKNKWNVTICITDDGGHTLLLTRMDGCAPVAKDRIAAGRVALLRMPPLPVQGGVPIMVQGECVGAVGVSGVQSHEDEQVCNAGIAALQ